MIRLQLYILYSFAHHGQQALFFSSSPHILTIRERILLGKSGHLVSAKLLNDLFRRIKPDIDQAMKEENGCISHFEVLNVEPHQCLNVA